MVNLLNFWSRVLEGLTGKSRRLEHERQQALYMSPLILQLNGESIAQMTDMYIPDQFWKHFKVEVITRDTEIKRRMFEDETFWSDEPLVLVRQVDGATFAVTDKESTIIFCLHQAKQLRETGELSIRGL